MQAILFADGEVGSREAIDRAWPGWCEPDAMVVAADGGARGARMFGFAVDAWVGDGDSLDDPTRDWLRGLGVAVEPVPTAKDQSDTELAVGLAVERGADSIVILGALGGARLDHALANMGLLALPSLQGRSACILDASVRVHLVSAVGGPTEPIDQLLPGLVGGIVSLVPFGDGVTGVTTDGLLYPLSDEPLPLGPARGLSNVRTADPARLRMRSGRILVLERPATLSP